MMLVTYWRNEPSSCHQSKNPPDRLAPPSFKMCSKPFGNRLTLFLRPTDCRTFQILVSSYSPNGSRLPLIVSENIMGSCGIIDRFFLIWVSYMVNDAKSIAVLSVPQKFKTFLSECKSISSCPSNAIFPFAGFRIL